MKKKTLFLGVIMTALLLPAALMSMIAKSEEGNSQVPPRPEGPCDIYAAAEPPVWRHTVAHGLCMQPIMVRSIR
jgi:hypothetical protein